MKLNIFEHYSQLENHITNAFLNVLIANPNLLSKILKDHKVNLQSKKLKALNQRLPQKFKNAKTIIDGTIFTEDFSTCIGIGIGIESKIVPNTYRHFEHLIK